MCLIVSSLPHSARWHRSSLLSSHTTLSLSLSADATCSKVRDVLQQCVDVVTDLSTASKGQNTWTCAKERCSLCSDSRCYIHSLYVCLSQPVCACFYHIMYCFQIQSVTKLWWSVCWSSSLRWWLPCIYYYYSPFTSIVMISNTYIYIHYVKDSILPHLKSCSWNQLQKCKLLCFQFLVKLLSEILIVAPKIFLIQATQNIWTWVVAYNTCDLFATPYNYCPGL